MAAFCCTEEGLATHLDAQSATINVKLDIHLGPASHHGLHTNKDCANPGLIEGKPDSSRGVPSPTLTKNTSRGFIKAMQKILHLLLQ